MSFKKLQQEKFIWSIDRVVFELIENMKEEANVVYIRKVLEKKGYEPEAIILSIIRLYKERIIAEVLLTEPFLSKEDWNSLLLWTSNLKTIDCLENNGQTFFI